MYLIRYLCPLTKHTSLIMKSSKFTRPDNVIKYTLNEVTPPLQEICHSINGVILSHIFFTKPFQETIEPFHIIIIFKFSDLFLQKMQTLFWKLGFTQKHEIFIITEPYNITVYSIIFPHNST